MAKKHFLEKIIETEFKGFTKGRKTIYKNVEYDFSAKTYYYIKGKTEKGGKIRERFKSPWELEAFIKDFETLRNKEEKNKSAYLTDITLAEYLETYINNYCSGLSESTLKGYNSCRKRILSMGNIGATKLKDLTAGNINNLFSERFNDIEQTYKEDFSNAKSEAEELQAQKNKHGKITTVKKDFDFFKSALKKAVDTRILIYNPLLGVDVVNKQLTKRKRENSKNATEITEFYTEEQVKKIVEICFNNLLKDNKFHNEDKNNIYAWGILIALFTGMRRGEVLGLKFSDIIEIDGQKFFDLQRARTHECKNFETVPLKTQNAYRYCAISPQLEKLMDFILKEYETDRRKQNYFGRSFIIARSNGELPAPSSFSDRCKLFLEKHGINPVYNFHSLRHTFATMIIKNEDADGNKITPYELYKLMGHENFEVTERYYIGKYKNTNTRHINIIANILSE